VRHQGQLHRQSIHPFVAYEAPEPLYAVQEIVFGRSHPALFGSGVGPGQFGEAEGLLLENDAHEKGEVNPLGRGEEGGSGVDSGSHPVVPWHGGTSFEGWRCGSSILLGKVPLFQSPWWVCVRDGARLASQVRVEEGDYLGVGVEPVL
jgi:hypothetical protein